MKILVIGAGGREHALAWKIASSPLVEKTWCSPGNAGIAEDVECVALDGQEAILDFCEKRSVSLVVVGPELLLVEGLADRMREAGIPVFGPNAKAAQLEGSKGFTKDLCRKYNIPTAAYGRFETLNDALAYVRAQGAPIVVKADGLAAGKGVVVAMTLEEAEAALGDMFAGSFGTAGASVVIEEVMEGEEASFFALCDGETAIEFYSAQDHKRVGEGDTGPNTGGMGTYAPPPVLPHSLRNQVMEEIIHPTVAAMKQEGVPYQGVLFAGLMITAEGPKLIEYNARFGDPETQSMLLQLESDLVPLLLACANGTLAGEDRPVFHDGASICVVMAAKGYPGEYEKHTPIKGLEKAASLPGIKIFHAGTTVRDGHLVSTGGRVLGVSARAGSLPEARDAAYRAVDLIDWPQGFCRRDIGWRALKN